MTDDLLQVALDLAALGKGRRRETYLRRAISSTYYALFHALVETFADTVVGRGADWEIYTPVYRFPDHATLARRLTLLDDQTIRLIASTLKRLQDHRLRADYDPAPFPLGRIEVEDLIVEARGAVAAVRGLSPVDRRRIVASLLSAKHR